VSIKVGGVRVASVTTGAAQEALRELGVLAGPLDLADCVVDLCFLTYVKDGLGSEYAAGVGIRPGMVGRKLGFLRYPGGVESAIPRSGLTKSRDVT